MSAKKKKNEKRKLLIRLLHNMGHHFKILYHTSNITFTTTMNLIRETNFITMKLNKYMTAFMAPVL